MGHTPVTHTPKIGGEKKEGQTKLRKVGTKWYLETRRTYKPDVIKNTNGSKDDPKKKKRQTSKSSTCCQNTRFRTSISIVPSCPFLRAQKKISSGSTGCSLPKFLFRKNKGKLKGFIFHSCYLQEVNFTERQDVRNPTAIKTEITRTLCEHTHKDFPTFPSLFTLSRSSPKNVIRYPMLDNIVDSVSSDSEFRFHFPVESTF